jgi:glucokinase
MSQAGMETHATIEDFFTGVDVGASKIDIADTLSPKVQRLETAAYGSVIDVLNFYVQTEQVVPRAIVIGMPGARDDETGIVTPTNNDEIKYPAFNPRAASERYGTTIVTKNDMEIAAAGLLEETAEDWQQIKSGEATETGTKLVGTHSSGIGTSAAVWDARSEQFVIMPAEGGHISWQPKNEWEDGYFKRLSILYPHVSAEYALSGQYGIDPLVDYALEEPDETTKEAKALRNAVNEARLEKYPTAAVLTEFATGGEDNASQATAREILWHIGAMTGSVLRDLTVATKATGGVYMTGGVALGIYEYLAENTEFNRRFVRAGAPHDEWLEKVPISLIVDPHAAAIGALALAKEL